MKKFIFVFVGLLGLSLTLSAEVIESVSFNPSRLGRYESLKISDSLNAPGGITTQYMTVQSNGVVSVNNAGNYEIPTNKVLGDLEMNRTEFQLPTLYGKGGDASFANTDKTSWIGTLNGNVVRIKGDIVNATTINILGDQNVSEYNDSKVISGLRLGNNNIPAIPSICSTGTMGWVERTSETEGKKYKVLAMKNCKQKTSKCIATRGSTSGKTFSSLAEANTADTCDGNAYNSLSFSSGEEVDDSYCDKASCIDYFNWSDSKTVQHGTWTNVNMSGSFTYSSTLNVCASSNISDSSTTSNYNGTHRCTNRLRSLISGTDKIISAAEACDNQCNGMASIPNGTRTCEDSCEMLPMCWTASSGSSCYTPGQVRYECSHLSLNCYTTTSVTYTTYTFARSESY